MGKKRELSQRPAEGGLSRRESETPKIPKEVLDNLPEDVRLSVLQAAAFSVPLPPPSMYQQYEAVLEGSAERILSMAEKEQLHRIDWERKALGSASDETERGQWLGFLVVIICLGSTVYLASHGHEWVAVVIASSCAVGLVGRFLQGRSSDEASPRSGLPAVKDEAPTPRKIRKKPRNRRA
jgi:uncharacterized membrane protein